MAFDISKFTQESVTAAGSTTYEKVPEGEYLAFIDDTKPIEEWFIAREVKKEGPNKGNQLIFFSIPWRIEDDALKAKLGRDKVIVFDEFILDLNESGGPDLGKGKNIKLNQRRAGVGQNNEGQPWNVTMLPGAGPAMIKVIHEANPNDKDNPRVRVDRVTAIR